MQIFCYSTLCVCETRKSSRFFVLDVLFIFFIHHHLLVLEVKMKWENKIKIWHFSFILSPSIYTHIGGTMEIKRSSLGFMFPGDYVWAANGTDIWLTFLWLIPEYLWPIWSEKFRLAIYYWNDYFSQAVYKLTTIFIARGRSKEAAKRTFTSVNCGYVFYTGEIKFR
jgi:hypothetical protein